MKLCIPPKQIVGDDLYMQMCWDHLHNTAQHAGVDIEIQAGLKKAADNAIEMTVDGAIAVYDYSDYLNLAPQHTSYDHWFRFHYTEGYHATPSLHSFPPISFLDWPHYYELEQQVRPSLESKLIWFKQAIFEGAGMPVDVDRCRRRSLAKEMLLDYFDAQSLDMEIWPPQEYWRRAGECAVSVHIPGGWRHSMDRAQLQMMGLGVCTVSPDIWTACTGSRPTPGVHYCMIDDRFADLTAKVLKLRLDPAERRYISYNAKSWFKQHCTPAAIWRHVAWTMSK